MIKTLQNTLKQDKEHLSVPKSVQDTIPIRRLWPDGLFQFGGKFSKTVRFSDINYAIASKEDKTSMFLGYSELLNALDTGSTTKITINNKRLNRRNFEQEILIPPQGDHLDGGRSEYNAMLLDKVTDSSNSMVQERYVTVSAHKKTPEEARTFFDRVMNDVTTAVQAFEMIDRLSLHLVEMAVPPGVAAFVTAKAFFLLLLNLPDGLSAVLTAGRFACKCQGRFDRKVAANIIPAAEGFYSVQRYANGFGDFPVSVSVRAEFYDLCFLMIGHHFSAPSKGAVLLYLPHWLPKNSTPSLWQIKKQPTGSPKRYLQAVLINFVLKRFILNPI